MKKRTREPQCRQGTRLSVSTQTVAHSPSRCRSTAVVPETALSLLSSTSRLMDASWASISTVSNLLLLHIRRVRRKLLDQYLMVARHLLELERDGERHVVVFGRLRAAHGRTAHDMRLRRDYSHVAEFDLNVAAGMGGQYPVQADARSAHADVADNRSALASQPRHFVHVRNQRMRVPGG